MVGKRTDQQTQVYLALPEKLPEGFAEILESVLKSGPIASVMMLTRSALENAATGLGLCQLSQSYGAAFLLGVDQENLGQGQDFLTQWKADGLHFLEGNMPVKELRKEVGADVILGCFCGLSRHQAMLAGEGGADYIAVGYNGQPDSKGMIKSDGHEFDHILEFIKWYLEMFELPLVSWNCGSYEDIGRLIAAGADFVAFDDLIWQTDSRADKVTKDVFIMTGRE